MQNLPNFIISISFHSKKLRCPGIDYELVSRKSLRRYLNVSENLASLSFLREAAASFCLASASENLAKMLEIRAQADEISDA